MGYHAYLKSFSDKKEVVINIKESMTNSKDFVNIFLEYTVNKSDEDKNKLFDEVIGEMANMIVGCD